MDRPKKDNRKEIKRAGKACKEIRGKNLERKVNTRE